MDGRQDLHTPSCALAPRRSPRCLRRLLSDAAGIDPSKHTPLDELGRMHDGWVIVDEKPRRTTEDLKANQIRLWHAVVALPGETPGVDARRA